jgi:SAM-dependent methyltransferase
MAHFQKITTRPDLYDWLYEDFEDDIPMYTQVTNEYSEVLECGVGTGRIAIPLAQKGKIIYGIDNSEEMLSRLEHKLNTHPDVKAKINLYNMDMRNFNLERTFPIALVPFSTFNYLMRIDEQISCLRSIKRHLNKGGVLVLELLSYSLFPDWFLNQPILRKVKEKLDQETGHTIQLWKLGSFDASSQVIKEERYFRHYSQEGKLLQEDLIFWENRFFFLGEITLLLRMEGFDISAVYGDFDFKPYTHSSQVFVILAQSS